MASIQDGGANIPGNLWVCGTASIGELDVTLDATVGTSITVGTFAKLTPTASPPGTAEEGMLYADTDHKLYFYNGTDWKEVAFV